MVQLYLFLFFFQFLIEFFYVFCYNGAWIINNYENIMINNNFSEGYKQILIETERKIKELWFKQLKELDIFIEILNSSKWTLKELFSIYGVNEKLVLEIISKTWFSKLIEDRKWVYSGMDRDLKETLLSSIKIANSFNKDKATLEDFLLAILKKGTWLTWILDFIGINSIDIENHVVDFIKNNSSDWIIDRWTSIDSDLDKIMGALEDSMDDSKKIFGGWMPEPWMWPDKQSSSSNTPALDFFSTNLTEEALNGQIDKVIGRDEEIDRLIAILNRKTKNNPVLVWEPWVGKTAVVEGLAKKIAAWEVPLPMRDKKILALDMSNLVAWTKYRWEFEARIKQIIEEASKAENEVILFIDEIHTIIWAWWTEGTLDASNILKPAMGRWKICVIGATTLNEYQKHIEKDSALERRFQQIILDEPSLEVSKEIISGLKESFEDYHNLIITDESVEEAISLSSRYITDRNLPDKAIDLIDEACSIKSMKYNVNEEEIKAVREKIEKLNSKIEDAVIRQKYKQATEFKREQKDLETSIIEMKKKFNIPKEKRFKVTPFDIQKVLSMSTWIQASELSKSDLSKLKSLPKALKKSIIGQDEAVDSIVNSIVRSKAWISNPNKPTWSFLFLWPTGVWKTELVKVLAKEFYWNKKDLIKVDMSEYNDKTAVSKLIWANAGYVGYEEWGQLTEKVRKNPYSIVLFDEIEKADFEVYNLLLQILDEGQLTDSKWRKVNFRNTIIIMTSNIGQEEFNEKASQIGFEITEKEEEKVMEDYSEQKAKVKEVLKEYFSPEFLNRIDKTIVFNPLDKKDIKKIVSLALNDLKERVANKWIEFNVTPSVINHISKEVYNPEYGAREVRRYIQDNLEDELASILIYNTKCDKIDLKVKANEFIFE